DLLSSSTFSFHDPPATEISTLSLHDALPIYCPPVEDTASFIMHVKTDNPGDSEDNEFVIRADEGAYTYDYDVDCDNDGTPELTRSEEHTSELQSRENLVCRLLLEKKKTPRNR